MSVKASYLSRFPSGLWLHDQDADYIREAIARIWNDTLISEDLESAASYAHDVLEATRIATHWDAEQARSIIDRWHAFLQTEATPI